MSWLVEVTFDIILDEIAREDLELDEDEDDDEVVMRVMQEEREARYDALGQAAWTSLNITAHLQWLPDLQARSQLHKKHGAGTGRRWNLLQRAEGAGYYAPLQGRAHTLPLRGGMIHHIFRLSCC